MESLYDQNFSQYTQCGDYLIPEMGLTEQEQKPVGKYGMMRTEGITERLKAKDQMAWVRKMNALHACAEEIVLTELVYD